MPLPQSPKPGRYTSGITTDPPYGPLADSGMPSPFFYHEFEDDFDNSLAVTGTYTITAASGSVAHTAGDGGLALLTTGATANNFAEIQVATADVTLPQGTTAGKKLFYLCRLQMSDVSGPGLIVGLCNSTATPFTAVADGIYFSKAAGGTVLNIISTVGSTATTTAIPTSAYTLTNATNLDLGFEIDPYGSLLVFVSPNMVGWSPQSGTGTTVGTRGACLRVTGLTLTTANLTPTIAVQTAGGAKTVTADFHMVSKER